MVEQFFTYKGENYRRFPAEPFRRFVVGLDIAQSHDFTALSVLEHQRVALPTWTTKPGANNYSNALVQDTQNHFDVRHLERLPLGMAYPAIISYVAEFLSREPLRDNCTLVADQTGVGAVVLDLFDAAGLDPVRVSIVSGSDAVKASPRRWHVSKTVLISALDARLNTGELRIAKALTEAPALAEELRDFRRIVTEAGRATYAARMGKHDDLVLSVALAVWFASEPRGRQQLSTHHYVGFF
jgi:hypothetical protein